MDRFDRLELILKITDKSQKIIGLLLCIYFVWSSDWLFIKLAVTNLLFSFLISYIKGFVEAAREDYELNYTIVD